MTGLGDTIYVWQTLDSRDGEWGIISMMIPALGMSSPLVARSLAVAEGEEYRGCALWHQQRSGDPIRLARFTLADTLEESKP